MADGLFFIVIGAVLLAVVYHYVFIDQSKNWLLMGKAQRLLGKQVSTVLQTIVAFALIVYGLYLALLDYPLGGLVCVVVVVSIITITLRHEYRRSNGFSGLRNRLAKKEPLDWGRSQERPDIVAALRDEPRSPADSDQ